ncbi:MAG: hypothetical protein IJ741_06475 [Schwartzia sp.]|nr:hypothetical protein [Schwartzia sp. (in: firmicutes)]
MKKSYEYKAILEKLEKEIDKLKKDEQVIKAKIEKLTEKAGTIAVILPHLEMIENDDEQTPVADVEYSRLVTIIEDELAA